MNPIINQNGEIYFLSDFVYEILNEIGAEKKFIERLGLKILGTIKQEIKPDLEAGDVVEIVDSKEVPPKWDNLASFKGKIGKILQINSNNEYDIKIIVDNAQCIYTLSNPILRKVVLKIGDKVEILGASNVPPGNISAATFVGLQGIIKQITTGLAQIELDGWPGCYMVENPILEKL